MTLPTASTPGYGLFRGRVACDCLIAWLPPYERELQRRGIIGGPLPIAQLVGDAPASKGAHIGGAFDFWMTVAAAVWIAREMGADATWIRDWPGNQHTHGVLTGCPHLAPIAERQIDSVRAGRDGTAANLPDDGPRPLSGRDWREGIEWQRQQEDEPVTPETIDAIAKAVMRQKFTINKGKRNEREVSVEQALRETLQRAAKDDPDDDPSNDA